MRSLVLLLGWVLLSGCSFVAVTAPPSAEKMAQAPADRGEPKCTTGHTAPAVDAIVAGLQVARTAYALSQSESEYQSFPISRDADIALGTTFVALFTASAIYGFSTVEACKDAKNTYARAAEQRATEPHAGRRHAGSPANGAHVGGAPAGNPFANDSQAERRGPPCTYDAQCEPTHVCEARQCILYGGGQ